MEELKRSLREAPIVEFDDYQYFVHPVTDGVPLVESDLLREIASALAARVNLDSVEKIVAPEAMGIHHAAALSLETDVPFVVVRKRSYGLDGEVSIRGRTGYGESDLYVNNVRAGDRVLVVDDVYSTGGTLSAVCSALEDIGAEIEDVAVVLRRGSEPADLPVELTYLLEVEVVDCEVVVREP